MPRTARNPGGALPAGRTARSRVVSRREASRRLAGHAIDPGRKLHAHRHLARRARDAAVLSATIAVEPAREIDPGAGLAGKPLLAALEHLDVVGEDHRCRRAERGHEADRAMEDFVRRAFEPKAVDAHDGAADRHGDGDGHLLLTPVTHEG